MIKVASVVGARPQIVKAAAFSRAVRGEFANEIKEFIIHSGQHYDHKLSQVFFEEMGIPQPDYNLQAGSASHSVQTANMLMRFEKVFSEISPDAVIVYGDTNSTIAAALAAAKEHIPVVHIEAGLRSFNKSMPEEINRITTDHCSTLLFTPTIGGMDNLINEGFNPNNKAPYTIDNPGVFHCGDIMLDNSLYFASIASKHSKIIETYDLQENNFVLATIHRDYNTDNPERLKGLLFALAKIADTHKVVLPLHPRTEKYINLLDTNVREDFFNHPGIVITPPLSFFDMIALEKSCKMVMTDSGGVQKEAYFFQKPVVILRTETEWTDIVKAGCGIITGSDPDKINEAFEYFLNTETLTFPPVFGDGSAAEFICETIIRHIR